MGHRETTTSVVRHWGSFFGGAKGNFDTETSPVTVTLPGTVAQVGTSNSSEYALLTRIPATANNVAISVPRAARKRADRPGQAAASGGGVR
jgi:hypothetical protein